MSFSIFLLCVVDCNRTDWHEININYIPNGYTLYRYFESYYKNIESIYINKDGKNYELKKIKSIENFIDKNPYRGCVYLYLNI